MHLQFINDSQLSDRFRSKKFPIQGRLILHLKNVNSIGFHWNLLSTLSQNKHCSQRQKEQKLAKLGKLIYDIERKHSK